MGMHPEYPEKNPATASRTEAILTISDGKLWQIGEMCLCVSYCSEPECHGIDDRSSITIVL